MANGGSPELGPKQFQADTSGLKGSGAESSRPLPQGLGSKQGERRENTHLERDDAEEPKAGVLHEVPAQHQDAAGCKGAKVRAAALRRLLAPRQPSHPLQAKSSLWQGWPLPIQSPGPESGLLTRVAVLQELCRELQSCPVPRGQGTVSRSRAQSPRGRTGVRGPPFSVCHSHPPRPQV